MSRVTNYVVLADSGLGDDEGDSHADDLPPPWVRVDQQARGGGCLMEGRVWVRAVNSGIAGPGPGMHAVLAELRAHPWDSPEDVTVMVKEQDYRGWRAVDWRDPSAA